MTGSLTIAQAEMTIKIKQLKRENDILKANIAQLRNDNIAMKDEIIQLQTKWKDEIGQLTTSLDEMTINNQNQIQKINSQSIEIVQLRAENQQIQVSFFST